MFHIIPVFYVCMFFLKKELKIKWNQIVLDYRLFTIK